MQAMKLIVQFLGALCLISLLGALLGWLAAPIVLEGDSEDDV